MPQQMTAEEMRKALKTQGVPSDRVEWLISREFGRDAAVATNYVQVVGPTLAFPIRIVLPWSALISENRRFYARNNSIFMTAEYRAARDRVKKLARAAMAVDGASVPPLARPLSLSARVWFPDKRIHDAPNFAGATHNALKQIVYEDDRWLYRALWERAGVDVDAPRAEIEITPL